nr:MAG TPA: hypothetical protein [Caudoviricetes sp.]
MAEHRHDLCCNCIAPFRVEEQRHCFVWMR